MSEDQEATNARLSNIEKLLHTSLDKLDQLARAFNVHQHNVVLMTTHPTFSPDAAEFVKTGKLNEDADSKPDEGRQ